MCVLKACKGILEGLALNKQIYVKLFWLYIYLNFRLSEDEPGVLGAVKLHRNLLDWVFTEVRTARQVSRLVTL